MIIRGQDRPETAQVDAQKRALRTTRRVETFQGSYSFAAISGDLPATLAASAALFQFANYSTTKLVVIRKLKHKLITMTAFGAAQQIGIKALIHRAITAIGTGSAGTAISFTGNGKLKKRSSDADPQIGVCRISTTAALTAITGTADAQPKSISSGLSTSGPIVGEIVTGDDEPIILAVNEGITLQNLVLFGADGVANLIVEMEWDEVLAY